MKLDPDAADAARDRGMQWPPEGRKSEERERRGDWLRDIEKERDGTNNN